MSKDGIPLAQVVGRAGAKAIQEALKPQLRAAGIRKVEAQIGKTARFFENVRHRGAIRLVDFLAACSALELEPVEFIRDALGDQIAPEVRTPRIVGRAQARIAGDGPGIGEDRLVALASALQSRPRQTRTALSRELNRAKKDELPRILGLYGSCLRIESDIDRAWVVLTRARKMARELRLPDVEADLLIRLAYVSLEKNQLSKAQRYAEQSTVICARLRDDEGEGTGFFTMGMFCYYAGAYRESLDDFDATLKYTKKPERRLATQQCRAHCLIRLNREDEAREAIRQAREVSQQPDGWVHGKLTWTEARLSYGTARLECLKAARKALSRERPADCALVTVELIEEALAINRLDIVEEEASDLCALLSKTGNPRVEKAILHLVRHQTRLTPPYVAQIRRAVEKAQARRLSRLIGSSH